MVDIRNGAKMLNFCSSFWERKWLTSFKPLWSWLFKCAKTVNISLVYHSYWSWSGYRWKSFIKRYDVFSAWFYDILINSYVTVDIRFERNELWLKRRKQCTVLNWHSSEWKPVCHQETIISLWYLLRMEHFLWGQYHIEWRGVRTTKGVCRSNGNMKINRAYPLEHQSVP